MFFWIEIENERRRYRYKVAYTPVSMQEEQFRVIGRNGSIVFSSNRPLYRNRGVMKRKPDLKLLDGYLSNLSVQQKIMQALQQYIMDHM